LRFEVVLGDTGSGTQATAPDRREVDAIRAVWLAPDPLGLPVVSIPTLARGGTDRHSIVAWVAWETRRLVLLLLRIPLFYLPFPLFM